MGLFDTIKEPVFLKEDSNAQGELAQLQELQAELHGEAAEQLAEEISRVNAGIYGEQVIHFELANSHIPMFVLHDLYFEHDGLTAQIDYLIVTRANTYVLECKNLYGDIEINRDGQFTRILHYGKKFRREGIYSPITQNRRHLELIKAMRSEERRNFLSKALFEKSFYEVNHAVVVLANPKTVLNDRYAKKEIRNQVIRADQLADYIRRTDAATQGTISERAMEELARYFLAKNKPCSTDHVAKFREMLARQAEEPAAVDETPAKPQEKQVQKAQPEPQPAAAAQEEKQLLCPLCGAPMIKRKATKGAYAGKEFYGCSNYPKCRGIVNIM